MIRKIFAFTFKAIVGLLALGTVIYFLGPRPTPPTLVAPALTNAANLAALETEINASEAAEPGIKPDCNARIVWADSTKKEKTHIALLYLHGFGASREEGAPIPQHIADSLHLNIYYARMSEHGVEEGDDNMRQLTADSYYQSAEKALHIAQQLGDSVVILATSGGGALGLFLCSRHPEVKALVAWSPAVALANPTAALLPGPWGEQLAKMIRGGEHNDYPFRKPEMKRYWTNHQSWKGIIQFSVFLKYAMTPETFAKIHCPVFVGCYYEDIEHQDQLVSVAAMKTMLQQIDTPPQLKRFVNFPHTRDHVIGSQILSADWRSVERESMLFLKEYVKI